MLRQREGFNSSYMTNGWMLRVRDLKVSCNVSNLLTWHFHPDRIKHDYLTCQYPQSLILREESQTDCRCSRGGCWGKHFEVFKNRLLTRIFGDTAEPLLSGLRLTVPIKKKFKKLNCAETLLEFLEQESGSNFSDILTLRKLRISIKFKRSNITCVMWCPMLALAVVGGVALFMGI
jgi:hypothetical protein